MKREVNPFDYAGEICKALPGGILLTTKGATGVNTMTIGWGTLGIEWGKPICTVFVRESRFTKGLLDKNPEFTIYYRKNAQGFTSPEWNGYPTEIW